MKSVVICSALRTPIGSFGGCFKTLSAVDLATQLTQKLFATLPQLPKAQVDEVILGQVLQAGCGQNPARQVALRAGLPDAVPAFTVNKVCGSGMKALSLAAQAIRCGDAKIILAGGTESMSNAPYLQEKLRWGAKLGHSEMVDVILRDGLWCTHGDTHMGITAENLAARFNISRIEQDAYAAESQRRCAQAVAASRFAQELVPVSVFERKKEIRIEVDEYPRPETTAATLAALRPAFKPDGTVTAGNASGINDGAALLLLADRDTALQLGLPILAEILSYASAGVAPEVMGLGPVPASQKALQLAGLSVAQMDRLELNEAFAVQSLAVMRELQADPTKTNVNGGAIALGHPIGASGARIVASLVHELRRNSLQHGLASLCIGGGQGIATVLRVF